MCDSYPLIIVLLTDLESYSDSETGNDYENDNAEFSFGSNKSNW